MKRWKCSALTLTLLAAALTSPRAAAQDDTGNVRINPVGFLIGFLNADLDFKLSETFTLGPSLGLINLSSGDTSLDAFAFGVRANLFLNGTAFTNSWYFGPSVTFGWAKLKTNSDEASTSLTSIKAIFGYQWVWPSGFNLAVAAGPQYLFLPKQVKNEAGNEIDTKVARGILPSGEFTVGFVF
ncbi:MAG TPA: hypothetical protein VM901_06120 [Bdellovibrionota bacterium]|jgi:hypothetical protein|nr:hypothetical protein [Bdellovibrionota bacterium]